MYVELKNDKKMYLIYYGFFGGGFVVVFFVFCCKWLMCKKVFGRYCSNEINFAASNRLLLPANPVLSLSVHPLALYFYLSLSPPPSLLALLSHVLHLPFSQW